MINKDNKYIIKYNKLLDDGNNNNKNKYLINILQNNGKIKSKIIKKDEKKEKENFEKEESTNFEIIDNVSNNSFDLENKSENNNNNDLEDSIEEYFINSPKKGQKYSKGNEINKNENENLKYNECEQEKVKEIKESNNLDNKFHNNYIKISKKQEKINNEILPLKEKIKEIKRDILNLIGEDDYKFIMDLFENKINNINEENNNDEICEEIENFSNNKYSPEKKEKFFDYYLLLVCNDCLLSKKINELQNLNVGF